MGGGGVVGPIRVLVVEDDRLVSRAFCRALSAAKHEATAARSLGQARECIAAAEAAAAQFEVVLVDLGLPDGDGEALLPMLRKLRPPPGLAVVSGTADDWRAVRFVRARIPVLGKPVGPRALVELVEILYSGQMRAADPIDAYCRRHGLSAQETLLVRASAEGLRTEAAAARLGCTAHTVRGYWQRIFRRTGMRSQPALFWAIAQSWTDRPPP